MSNARPFALLALAALAAAGACRREAASGEKRYPLEGTVTAVDAASRTVTIAHGEIVGLMPAMTMPFVVLERDRSRLSGFHPGDLVRATIVARDSRLWLEDLAVRRSATPSPSPS